MSSKLAPCHGFLWMDIPVPVVTADATDTTKKEIFRLGANDYITKPVKPDILCRKIRKDPVGIGR